MGFIDDLLSLKEGQDLIIEHFPDDAKVITDPSGGKENVFLIEERGSYVAVARLAGSCCTGKLFYRNKKTGKLYWIRPIPWHFNEFGFNNWVKSVVDACVNLPDVERVRDWQREKGIIA